MTAVAESVNSILAYQGSNAVGPESQGLRVLLETVQRHLLEPISRNWLEALSEEVLEVCKGCTRPDWDGYGAKAISSVAVGNALKFLALLPLSTPEPEVTPEVDGTIGFEWYASDDDRVFSLDVSSDGLLTYAGFFGEQAKTRGTEVLGTSVPQSIVAHSGQADH